MRKLVIVSVILLNFLVVPTEGLALDSEWKVIWEKGVRALKASKLNDAQADFERAEALASKIGKYSSEIGVTFSSLCEVHDKLGQSAVAENYCGKAVAVMQVSDGKNHPNTIVAMSNLAQQFQKNSKYAEAEKVLQGAMVLLLQNGDRQSLLAQTVIVNLATTYKANGKLQSARDAYATLLAVLEKLDESKPRIETLEGVRRKIDELNISY